MEKFFYIADIGTSNVGFSYPIEHLRGMHPASDTTLNLYFTPIHEMGLAPDKDNDIFILTITANKHKDVMQSIVEAMNLEENLIVIMDVDNSIVINSNISGFSFTLSSDV
tara:strand:- start:1147 stop:1476 length:330 start_codon:yes stop_codon:yes gene_type:complete